MCRCLKLLTKITNIGYIFATTVCVLRIIFNMKIKTHARRKSLNIQIVFIIINLPLIWPVRAKTQYDVSM